MGFTARPQWFHIQAQNWFHGAHLEVEMEAVSHPVLTPVSPTVTVFAPSRHSWQERQVRTQILDLQLHILSYLSLRYLRNVNVRWGTPSTF